MSPTNLDGCWHECCGLETVHDHPVRPEQCLDCASMRTRSERARALEERAKKIAEKDA